MTETLYIDANEPSDVQQKVQEELISRDDIDVDIEIEGLKTGDFLIGDLVIERKEASDLAGSITDGRLREQTSRMSADFQHRYLLLEGNPYDLKYSNLHPNSIVGSLVSTNCKRDIDIIPVEDYDSLAYAVYKVAKLYLEQEDEVEEHHLKSTSVDKEDLPISMLTCIDGISKQKARDILKAFGMSWSQFLDEITMAESEIKNCKFDWYDGNTVYQQLQVVDGIGPTLADRIISAFREG